MRAVIIGGTGQIGRLTISSFGILAVFKRLEAMPRKTKRTCGVKGGSRKVGKRIDWFWESHRTEEQRRIEAQ